jgi:hypothetical protein
VIVDPRPCIYFLKPIGLAGPIKVGFTIDVRGRLSQCMKWSPYPLEIIAAYPVTGESGRARGLCSFIERRFHLRYAGHYLHHEWFETHPLILADIEAINAGTFDVATLPEWGKIYKARQFYPGAHRPAAELPLATAGHDVTQAQTP